MSKRIDYGELSDRELLILTVQATNDISSQLTELNGTVRNHENRLGTLEVADKIRAKINNCHNPVFLSKNQLTIIGTICLGAGMFIGGIIYGIIKLIGF